MCRIRFKGSSSMSSHFTTTPASDRPGLPKPLPSLARASRLKRSPSLQNVNAAFTSLNCRCSWCVTDMRARFPLGPHVSDTTDLRLSHCSNVRIHARRDLSLAPALQQRDGRESATRAASRCKRLFRVNDTTAILPSAAHINDTRLPMNLLRCQPSIRQPRLIAIRPLY